MRSVRSTVVAVLTAAGAVAAAALPAAAGVLPSLPPGDCRVDAEAPSALGTFYTTAAGSFECATPRDMTLSVCLEYLDRATWRTVNCGGAEAYGTFLSAETFGCEWGVFVYRSVAVGHASGRTYTASSAPVPFYCSPL